MSNDPYMIYGKNIRHVDDEGKFLTKNILIEKGLLKKIIGCRYAKEKNKLKILRKVLEENHIVLFRLDVHIVLL